MANILLIDDENAITDGVQEELDTLQYQGKIKNCKLNAANNFYEAKNVLDGTPCDLIITDLLMPPYGLESIPERRHGVMLSGWSFLYHYVLKPDAKYYRQNKNAVCIIFSAYLERLKKHGEYLDFLRTPDRGRLITVDKGNIFDGSGGFDKLRDTIAEVLGSKR